MHKPLTCVPFQRGTLAVAGTADTVDTVDEVTWRQLKVGIGFVFICSSTSSFVCLFCLFCLFCLLAFLHPHPLSESCSIYSRKGQARLSCKQLLYIRPECHVLAGSSCCHLFHQISKKDSGVYDIVLKDDRGKDKSTLNLTDQGNCTSALKSDYTPEHLGEFAAIKRRQTHV